MNREEAAAIALDYANKTKSKYYSLDFLFARESVVMDKYWDVGFRVLNDFGNEIDGPLLIMIEDETKKIYTLDEVISNNIGNPNFKMNTDHNAGNRHGICQQADCRNR